ncbi:DUF805 domain-containing protein [Thiomicrorhabdus sp.]|uniref:DUF805 domain-containing protein n=1 Tax=Thiomicrorhabdus sp. TaxID=2039724 RepID=UPI002AA811BB|nr:DUF805 domain-containing protein [Thiomicrorhabdus sp.]
MNFFIDAIKNYATFTGRATRQQYWMFYLFYIIFYIILSVLENALGLTLGEFGEGILTIIYSLALLIPSIAILARRLHDTGRSGWWILLIFIPLIGAIVILIFTLLDSERQANEYGESIKY